MDLGFYISKKILLEVFQGGLNQPVMTEKQLGGKRLRAGCHPDSFGFDLPFLYLSSVGYGFFPSSTNIYRGVGGGSGIHGPLFLLQ